MKKRILYTDKLIIEGLRNKEHRVIEHVYKTWFSSIESLVLRNNGGTEDAEDVFQDALVVLYKKIVFEDFTLTSALKTYFYSICKNLWMQRLYKKGKLTGFNNMPEQTDGTEETDLTEEKFALYKKHFLQLSDDCKKILTLFLKKVSLKAIAGIMQHSSPDYTKTRKYLCQKELKKRIVNDPEYKRLKNER